MAIQRTIIFIGPQGSGKGTQAKLLAEKIQGQYIGSGSIFRQIAKEDSEFGRYIKNLIDNGLLATDADVEKIIKEKLESFNENTPVIFDGVPRRLSQAEFLVSHLHLSEKKDIATIYITLPREEAVNRMRMRRICVGCEKPTALQDEMDERACHLCGGKLVQRADDTDESINKRLDIYYSETLPVIDYLKEHSDFHEIDGTQSIEKIESEISDIFGAMPVAKQD